MKTVLALAILVVAVLQIEAGHYYKPYHGYYCKAPGHYEHPKSCALFIQCDAHGKAFIRSCPYGTVFNPYIQVCDHKYNYKCHSYKPGYKHGYGYKKNPCKHKYDALLPYKKNCHYFIHCSNGYGYVKACPARLVWNNYLKRCDWYDAYNSYTYCHYYK